MKIIVVGPTYPYRGGISHYTTLLVRYLRQAGHTTLLYSFSRQYPEWLFPGVTDKDPSQAPLSIDCEYVLDSINPLTWWKLCRMVRAENPDLLLLQWWVPFWTPSTTFISRWIKRHTSIPIVFICHEVLLKYYAGPFDHLLSATVLGQADTFIVHTEQDGNHLRKILPRVPIIKSHHPTYAELADQSEDQLLAPSHPPVDLPDDCPILLFFGFVRPYKGLEYLIGALPLVLQHMKVHLLVVGEFWLSPEVYWKQARDMGVEQAMTFVNQYVPNEKLQAYFDMADVVVLPYVSAAQSGVIQLTFAFGKPIIATSVGGLHEIVHDGVTGLIVPPRDSAALAQAIVRYFQDQMSATLAHNVQQLAINGEYAWQRLVEDIEQVSQNWTLH